jgi:hypothetical protein
MEHRNNNWGLIAIILLLVLFLFQSRTGHQLERRADSLAVYSYTHTFNHYDTTVRHLHLFAPRPSDSTVAIIPAAVDTMEILRRYFTAYFYQHSFADSNISATISDSLKENKIVYRAFSYKLLRPVAITQVRQEISPYRPGNRLFIGVFGGVSLTGRPSIGPEALFLTKKDRAYKLSYDAINGSIQAGTHWKISLRKR